MGITRLPAPLDHPPEGHPKILHVETVSFTCWAATSSSKSSFLVGLHGPGKAIYGPCILDNYCKPERAKGIPKSA